MDNRNRLFAATLLQATLFLSSLLLFTGFVASANFVSDGVFDTHVSSTGRGLLQAKKSCPVNFEFMNYAIITSKCKGPQYPPKLCCDAFKEFACPYAAELNDGTNDCATTMFSYINLYGKYPPGLFASECREGKNGLSCFAVGVKTSNVTTSSGHWAQKVSPTAVIGACSILAFVLF